MCEFPQYPVSESKLKQILKMKEKHDLCFNFHAPLINDLGNFHAEKESGCVELIKKAIDTSNFLEADFVNMHCGYRPFYRKKSSITKNQKIIKFMAKDVCNEILYKSLNELVDYAGYNDIRLTIENVDSNHSFLSTKRDFTDILKRVPKIYACLDVGHANVTHENNIDIIRTLKGKLKAIHLHDNDGIVDSHEQLGKGNIDFKRIFKSLKKINFDGYVIIEPQAGFVNAIKPSRSLVLSISKEVNLNII